MQMGQYQMAKVTGEIFREAAGIEPARLSFRRRTIARMCRTFGVTETAADSDFYS